MNYRHIFHAGNICDVVKHGVLTLAITALRGKDKGFCILDTHAGTGLYDLRDGRALKTGEAQNGIYRLLAAPPVPALADYYRVLRELNPGWHAGETDGFQFYPGSPMIAAQLLRPQDRLIVCELHDGDAAELRRPFRHDKRVHIHHRDGYEALTAFLPPAEKRGLAFIDPPFEGTNEFSHLTQNLVQASMRWAQGMFLVWYPIKDRPAVWRFHEELTKAAIPKMLNAEFIFDETTPHDKLQGCGFIWVNPPWKMDENLRPLFAELHRAMRTAHEGVKVEWLSAE